MNKEMNDSNKDTYTAQLRNKEAIPCESIHVEHKTGKADL